MHLQFVDYSMYWVQYAGVFQIPKGVIAGPRGRVMERAASALRQRF